jgi:hypothetical protein
MTLKSLYPELHLRDHLNISASVSLGHLKLYPSCSTVYFFFRVYIKNVMEPIFRDLFNHVFFETLSSTRAPGPAPLPGI